MKISDLNLQGFDSEYINVLRENDPEDNNLYDFPFSHESIHDFNNRIVTIENYKNQIEIYNFLMIDDENSKKLALDIAKLNKKNRDGKFMLFYSRFVNNKFETKEQLQEAIKEYCKEQEKCEEKYGFVEYWDVSGITDMSEMFYKSQFDGDISRWDVSNVKNMFCMFANGQFDGDISEWDVSNVETMYSMFYHSQFNGDISGWDVSNVKFMTMMFNNSQFDGDISRWDVSNVENMTYIFGNGRFKGDISGWDLSNLLYK